MFGLCRLPALRLAPGFSRPLRALARVAASSTNQLQRPLVETSPDIIVPYQELLDTFRKCEELLSEEVTRFKGQDQPTKQDLQRELSWLLEDAIHGCTNDAETFSPEYVSKPPLWPVPLRSAKELEKSGLGGNAFAMRVAADGLLDLWSQRVKDRVPLQYIVGAAHWRDMVLAVGPGVLIPRPETEQLVDFVDEELKASPELATAPWADLGCGSGAIACALAKTCRQTFSSLKLEGQARVFACDISPVAVEYTKLNARRLGVNTTVEVRQGSWCEPLAQLQGCVGGIVSNPPYIPPALMSTLQIEVGRHEPHLALSDSSPDGMDALRMVASCASDLLCDGGFLAVEACFSLPVLLCPMCLQDRLTITMRVEWQPNTFLTVQTHGGDQADAFQKLLQSMQRLSSPVFSEVAVRHDLFGVARFVIARRCNPR